MMKGSFRKIFSALAAASNEMLSSKKSVEWPPLMCLAAADTSSATTSIAAIQAAPALLYSLHAMGIKEVSPAMELVFLDMYQAQLQKNAELEIIPIAITPYIDDTPELSGDSRAVTVPHGEYEVPTHSFFATSEPRADMIARLVATTHRVMDLAQAAFQEQCMLQDEEEKWQVKPDCLNKIVIAATSEFFFSLPKTTGPMRLDEFQHIIHSVANHAKLLHENVIVDLGTLQIQDEEGTVHNVIITVQGGVMPLLNVTAKTFPHETDPRYPIPLADDASFTEKLMRVLPFTQTPTFAVGGISRPAFSEKTYSALHQSPPDALAHITCIVNHEPTILCKTAGGAMFSHTVEICLDHQMEVLEHHLADIADSAQPVARVISSNIVDTRDGTQALVADALNPTMPGALSKSTVEHLPFSGHATVSYGEPVKPQSVRDILGHEPSPTLDAEVEVASHRATF